MAAIKYFICMILINIEENEMIKERENLRRFLLNKKNRTVSSLEQKSKRES